MTWIGPVRRGAGRCATWASWSPPCCWGWLRFPNSSAPPAEPMPKPVCDARCRPEARCSPPACCSGSPSPRGRSGPGFSPLPPTRRSASRACSDPRPTCCCWGCFSPPSQPRRCASPAWPARHGATSAGWRAATASYGRTPRPARRSPCCWARTRFCSPIRSPAHWPTCCSGRTTRWTRPGSACCWGCCWRPRRPSGWGYPSS